MQRAGKLFIEQVDAAELSPGEFAHRVRKRVDEDQIKTVVIDSLNGYQSAMPEENSLILHIHELLQYLNRCGAATFMTVAQHGLVGDMKAPVDVTYLADTVILLRYFEALAAVRRAMSIIKMRTGAHESPRSANIASTAAGSPSAGLSMASRASWAGSRSMPGRVSPCSKSLHREAGRDIGACRYPGADRTRRPGRRRVDPGGGSRCRCLRRSRCASAEDGSGRGPCRDRRRGDQDREFARTDALAQRTAAWSDFPIVLLAPASGRRSRT